MTTDQLIKQKDVAKMLGITANTLNRYLNSEKDFPRPIKLGKTRQAAVFFKLDEIHEYIEKNRA